MPLELRKLVAYTEALWTEGGRTVPKTSRLMAVAAVLRNPWANSGFVEDLTPKIREIAPELGHLLTEEILKLAGGGEGVEGYGKSAVIGSNGEIEHGSALIHTLRFGNHYRRAVGAKSYLAFTNTRGGPGAAIQIPLMHKEDEGMRSHYETVQFSIDDAPGSDEIVVALGASSGGRPHHRIGDRYKDLQEMGDLHG